MLILCAVTLRPQSCNCYIIQVACQYKILKLLKYVTAQYNTKNTFYVDDFLFITLSSLEISPWSFQ